MRQNVQNDNFSESVAIVPPLYEVFGNMANDSDKSWVVPDNEIWKLNFLAAKLSATATVGNRQIAIEISDASGNQLINLSTGTFQGASITRAYNFIQGVQRETVFINFESNSPLPPDLYLGSGYTLRVYDTAAVDVAADDMTVSFQAERFII